MLMAKSPRSFGKNVRTLPTTIEEATVSTYHDLLCEVFGVVLVVAHFSNTVS
jgi:uncharacterized membrane protein